MLKKILAFTVAATAAFIITYSNNVSARYTLTHGFDCAVVTGEPYDADWSLANNSTADMVATCAFPESDRFQKKNIDSLVIYGWDGNNDSGKYPQAMACYAYRSAHGGACGAMDTETTSRASYFLHPSKSQWNTETNGYFGYVWVKIPGQDGSYRSTINGVYAFHD